MSYLLCLVLCTSCTEFVPEFGEQTVEGFRPIYGDEIQFIQLEGERAFRTTGQVHVYSHFLLVEEVGKGYHLIENIDPSQPKKTGFFQIYKNEQISIKGNVIYANSGSDLLAISIGEDGQLTINTLEDVFELKKTRVVPNESDHYFECLDATKGRHVGWEFTTIENPQCYY